MVPFIFLRYTCKFQVLIYAILPQLLFISCIAGGSFIEHTPPVIKFGEPIKIKLTLSVNAGDANKAFTAATLCFNFDGNDHYNEAIMKPIGSSKTDVVYSAELLPIDKTAGISKFTYYFKYVGDGKNYFYPERPQLITVNIVEAGDTGNSPASVRSTGGAGKDELMASSIGVSEFEIIGVRIFKTA